MQRLRKTILLNSLLGLVLFFCIVIASYRTFHAIVNVPVYAQDETLGATGLQKFLQDQFCKQSLGIKKPYKNLVLVDLNQYFPGVEQAKYGINIPADLSGVLEFLYEYLYTYKYGLLPFNAIVYNGKVFYTTCNEWDFTLGVYANNSPDYGSFVIGVLGEDIQANIEAINSLGAKFRFDSLYTAGLVPYTINDKSVLIAKDWQRCLDNCVVGDIKADNIVLSQDAIKARPVDISLADIKFPKDLESLASGTVTLRITNNSSADIVSSKYERLYIKEMTAVEIPDLYVKDWESLHIPVIINQDKVIKAHESVDVVFKVGPYVYPKTYKGKFAIFYGDKKLKNSDFEIAIKVRQGSKKLGLIIGRELDYVNVRAKPDLRAQVVFKLDVGEYVVVNKVDGAWVNITSQYGDTGWVYRPLIKILD